jgi:hypothetical protein
MEQGPYWEASSCLDTWEILHLVWNFVHKSLQLVSVLRMSDDAHLYLYALKLPMQNEVRCGVSNEMIYVKFHSR